MARTAGYATEKRAKMLEYLKEHSDRDVCVKEIEEYLSQNNITVNVTTIYRYIDKLVQEEIVLKHTSENGNTCTYQYIDPNHSCHNHLHMKCSSCGRIYHMDCEFMDEFQRHIYEHHHFALECRTSMLYGLCEHCQGKKIM